MKSHLVIIFILLITTVNGQDYALSGKNINFAILYTIEGMEYAADAEFNNAILSWQKSREYDSCNLETNFYINLLSNQHMFSNLDTFFQLIISLRKGRVNSADSIQVQTNYSESNSYLSNIISALIKKKQEMYIESITMLNKAIAIAPEQEYLYYLRGGMNHKSKNYVQAIEDYTMVLQTSPCSWRTLYERGLSYYRLNMTDRAIRDFEAAMVQAPLLKKLLEESLIICEVYNQSGIEKLHKKQNNLAVVYFSLAIEIHPSFSEPYLNRGVAYRNMNQMSKAISDFNRAINLNEQYIDAFYQRGYTFQKMGQFDQAVKDLKTVLYFDPEYQIAYYNLGEIYFKLEQFNDAVSMYNQCLDLDPEHIWSYYKRAQAYDRQKKYLAAITDYDTFFMMTPDSLFTEKVEVWERSRLLKKWVNQRK